MVKSASCAPVKLMVSVGTAVVVKPEGDAINVWPLEAFFVEDPTLLSYNGVAAVPLNASEIAVPLLLSEKYVVWFLIPLTVVSLPTLPQGPREQADAPPAPGVTTDVAPMYTNNWFGLLSQLLKLVNVSEALVTVAEPRLNPLMFHA